MSPSIGFLGQTYSSRSKNISAQRTINFYPELNPQDSKSVIALIGTPGLDYFTAVGDVARGMHIFNGVMFVVAGSDLYSIASDGTVSSSLGTLSTSSGRVSMADNGIAASGIGGNQLMIVDGVAGYIYNVSTLTFSNISSNFPAGGASQVTYIDGYFVVIGTSTMNAYASELYDGLTWDALATSPISGAPDILQAVINSHQQIWFIKEYTAEVWYDAGVPTSTGFPFARVPGAVIDYGTVAPFSLVRAENTIFWVASQRNNDVGEFVGIVMLNGYQPQVISPPAINYQIGQMVDISDATSYSYSEGGHTFVVFTFPTGNATYVYDTTTEMWHERSFYSGVGLYTINRHVGDCYCFLNGKHYVSDYRNGNIYEMSSAYLDDNGTAIVSTRVAQHIYEQNELDNIFFSKLQVDLEVGTILDDTSLTGHVCSIASSSGKALVTLAAHGYSVNTIVTFQGSLPAGITDNINYYIIDENFTVNQFEISLTLGGAAVTLS
jgi:hypothetical protein